MTPSKTLIIAEAGVNHNGDIDLAHQLVKAAADAGADMIKFQTFKAKHIASKHAEKAAYQKRTTQADENQRAMLKRLELPATAHFDLVQACTDQGIAFLSTAGDIESLHFLVSELGLKTIKLGSGELTNAPLLLEAGKTSCDLILSTGMGTLADVETALGIIAFGAIHGDASPSEAAFKAAFVSPEGQQALQDRVSLMQCTTEYPSQVEDCNLRVMDTFRAAFRLPVGYSDHTEGNVVSFAAAALGATLLEKHFTLDTTMEGPDHAASIEPDDLANLVQGVRLVERSLGSSIKIPSPAELRNQPIVRRSLVATRDLPAGHSLTANDVAVKRPGTGMAPIKLWDTYGRQTRVAIVAEQMIHDSDLV